MPTEPTIVERAAQPYVAIKGSVTMQTFSAVADRFPEVFGWLAGNGIPPADAPFFRYDVIDMATQLVIEACVPVAEPVRPESGEVFAAVLPAGRYATLTHVGHPQELVGVTGGLLDWAAAQGLTWDMRVTDAGEEWAGRIERLLTNPNDTPDMTKWETQLLFKLAH
jgi:DNA gyrase inhibitor GyrI